MTVLKTLLSKVENLQLLHKQCHKEKTGNEPKKFVSIYLLVRSDIDNTPKKLMDKHTLELVTLKTLVELCEVHNIKETLHLELKDAHRLERIYQMAKKSLQTCDRPNKIKVKEKSVKRISQYNKPVQP